MPMNANDTPQSLGYRWPAEWEPHAATWIAWPHNVDTWRNRFASIPSCFATIVRELVRFEPVRVLVGGDEVRRQAEEMVGDLDHVALYDIPTNDAWIRDYGPMFVQPGGQGDMAAVDWQFNSWGGKYRPWDLDNAVAERLARQLRIRRFSPRLVIEGGAIDGNGRGTVLTTESCLLDPRRNARVNRHGMEEWLRRYCCAREVIWIAGGPIAGDDTDGHVDQLARFVSPRQVVVAVENNRRDENHQPLQTNVRMLQNYRDSHREPLEVIQLPMPSPIHIEQRRVPASYCNFYIANRCVLVPTFDDAMDVEAIRILQALFADREVIGIPARDLAWGLGAIHCLTLQQPVARSEHQTNLDDVVER